MSSTNKKQLIALAILAVLNLLMSNFAVGDGRTLEGRVVAGNSTEMQGATIRALLFGIQFISFTIGAIIALVPYKGIGFKEKWLNISLSMAVLIQSAFLIMSAVKIFSS
ncbi:hypothetical protein [Hymenobacter sediminicola]|uniref:Uncharacterized protein n=1 Tax=Hymenobacter sediminicola TaxID=2761579 RepID=A0A7G7W4H6_9BACT|nr:hypothetical protein [Hymenobacter sediminicola]QNH61269.1 hypothetical protein H4317_13995 [Hymenobacter sediminicola]